MKDRPVAFLLLTALLALAWTPAARAMAIAPDGSPLPIECSPALNAPHSAALASHTSSHRPRVHRRHHRHVVHHRARATSTGLRAGRDSAPTQPEAPHHPDRRAALPHVTRDHRPPQQHRSSHRGMTAAAAIAPVRSVPIQGVRPFEHDSFSNFAGGRAAGRGPPRSPPSTALPRSLPAACAGGPLPHPAVPAPTISLRIAHTRAQSALPAPRASAPGAGPLRLVDPGPPSSVSLAVRLEGATACLELPSVGGLT